ncbi:MAG: Yip1 family protein [Pseudomonadota bacterium]
MHSPTQTATSVTRQFRPLRSIWLQPGETISRIAHENPGYLLFVLPIVAGFWLFPADVLFDDFTETSYGLLLQSLLSFSPLFELIAVFIGAWLVRLTGRWLGGKGDIESLQVVFAWSNVPVCVMAVLSTLCIALLMLVGIEPDETPSWGENERFLVIGLVLVGVQVALSVWSLVIFFYGIAAVQGFSLARAVANGVLAWLIPALTLLALATTLQFNDYVHW